MTIKSHPLDFAVSMIAVAGCAFGTCKSSADIPICSAIASASPRTLTAGSVQAASKRSISPCEGIHPEACPPLRSNGNGSVAVITGYALRRRTEVVEGAKAADQANDPPPP